MERVVEIIFHCCQALDYAHRRGVIHRDIKPGNIMVTYEGTTKINDFSIALMTARGDGTTPGVAEGTPHYMAPEQIRGVDVGPATDIYALGAVLFELVAGERVFQERDVRKLFRTILRVRPPKVSEYVPECPTELVGLIERALAKKPADRFESCSEMAAALGRVYQRQRRSGRRLAARTHRDQLRGIDFFAGFTDAETEAVLEAGSLIQFSAGEAMIREGDLDTSFYLLVVGSASVSKRGARIETLGRGDCFGEMGFLTETRRTATITADSDVVLLRVSKAQLDMAPPETQLLYYRAFTETLIYRLTVTSARLAAALKSRGKGRADG
jgi:serine/threonine-protein kinase